MQSRNNTIKLHKRHVIVICIAILLLLCLSAGLFRYHRTAEFPEETIVFGEEWAHWTDYLVSMAKEEDFAYAFVENRGDSADFFWGFYEDREAFVTDFAQKKAEIDVTAADVAGKDESESGQDALSWYFVKFRMDEDVHGTDIYEYLQRNLSEDGYSYHMCTLDEGNLYAIWQVSKEAYEEQGYTIVKRDALVSDGYLYFLVCEDMNPQNREEVNEEMVVFESQFHNGMYRTGTVMEEEDLYRTDHENKVVTLENPHRVFYQERATDLNWPDKIMANFWLLREAEYQISLSPALPEMIISFKLQSASPEGEYETYLFNGFSIEDTYRMEIRSAADDTLIQQTDMELTIHNIDTISFEDIDNDGCMEMRIIYPAYWSGWDEIDVHHEDYWTWDAEIEKMVRTDREQLLARRDEESGSDNEKDTAEEATDAASQEFPYKRIVVGEGDFLWKLSEEYYGDGRMWWKIYEYNRQIIGENPSLILPGTELEIPFWCYQ